MTTMIPPAAADTVTFTSSQVGTSGQTAPFAQSVGWQMAWSFDCSNYGSSGNFTVSIKNPTQDSGDIGPNELAANGSGTDYYTRTGTFSLSVISECTWSIQVSPSTLSPASGTASFASSSTGDSGNTSEFTESGPWQMAWSYDCSNFGSQGNFAVAIKAGATDTANIGPNELGPSGSGVDHYTDAGTFNLAILSECHWSIGVSAESSPAPTPSQPPSPPAPPRSGYWMLGVDGHIYAFGDAQNLGDAAGQLPAGARAVHVEPTPDGNGYWIVSNLGDVYAEGDAAYLGSHPQLSPGEQVASLSSTADGRGYWIFTNLGRAVPYGNAGNFGDMSGTHLNGPVLDSVRTADGMGYYMVGSDGGIFTFGDAHFGGSMGGKALNAPVVGLAPTTDGAGYWLVATDGGIFSFNAPFQGSMGGTRLNKPVIGMVAFGDGYLMVGSDGGIFDFSSLPFKGSLGASPPANPIVGVAALG